MSQGEYAARQGIPAIWTCTGNCGAQSGAVSGNYAGSFTGAGAPGVGIVYGVFDTGNNGQIIGAQGFKR